MVSMCCSLSAHTESDVISKSRFESLSHKATVSAYTISRRLHLSLVEKRRVRQLLPHFLSVEPSEVTRTTLKTEETQHRNSVFAVSYSWEHFCGKNFGQFACKSSLAARTN